MRDILVGPGRCSRLDWASLSVLWGRACAQQRLCHRRGAHPGLLTHEGGEPPGQPGFTIQTCEEEHKEAIYAAAIATLDFTFIPKHELSSPS